MLTSSPPGSRWNYPSSPAGGVPKLSSPQPPPPPPPPPSAHTAGLHLLASPHPPGVAILCASLTFSPDGLLAAFMDLSRRQLFRILSGGSIYQSQQPPPQGQTWSNRAKPLWTGSFRGEMIESYNTIQIQLTTSEEPIHMDSVLYKVHTLTLYLHVVLCPFDFWRHTL